MALRSAPSLRFRAVYEDFQPKSEFTETPEAHILHVHLPGFVRDQLRIRYVNITNVTSISGERPIAGGVNKWSRFNQVYPVPESCDVKRLRAKFDQGILTITMPKKFISQAAAPREEVKKTAQEKAPAPSEGAVAQPKTEKAEMETHPKSSTTTSVEEPRVKKTVSFADLKAPSPSKEAVAEPKTEKAQVESPPKSTSTSVEEPREKKSVSFADLKAPSPLKEALAESKTEKAQVESPPKSTSTSVEEPREKKSVSFADLKAPSPAKEAVAEPETEKAQVESPPESTSTSVEEPREKKSVSFADLKAPSPSKEAVAEPKTEKAQEESPPKSTSTSVEEPHEKKSVSFADQKAPKDQEDTTTAQTPLPDIKKPAHEKGLRSLTPVELFKDVIKPQVVQGEIQQKPTEKTADPKLQTVGVVQKGEEFEPKPALPIATKKQTNENTQKGPEEYSPKTTLSTAPLASEKQIDDKLQNALGDIMQKHGLRTVPTMQTDEKTVGRRAEDAEEKEAKETIAKPSEPRIPEKGMEKGMVKATESRDLGMAAKPAPKTPEKEKEATSKAASIYKEKNIIDTIGRGIKEVAASTSYAVTNIAEHKLKDEEKNLLSMVIAALAAHVSYRITSHGKPQN